MSSVLGTARAPRSEMSDVSGFHVKEVMDMDLDELLQKYNRTVRAAGLLRYMLEVDHGVTEEPEQKTWHTALGVPAISSMEAPQGVVLLALCT